MVKLASTSCEGRLCFKAAAPYHHSRSVHPVEWRHGEASYIDMHVDIRHKLSMTCVHAASNIPSFKEGPLRWMMICCSFLHRHAGACAPLHGDIKWVLRLYTLLQTYHDSGSVHPVEWRYGEASYIGMQERPPRCMSKTLLQHTIFQECPPHWMTLWGLCFNAAHTYHHSSSVHPVEWRYVEASYIDMQERARRCLST